MRDRSGESQRRRPTTTQRGYGSEHQKLRKQWAKKVEQGLAICTRCQRMILPGQEWHLDHHDWDRSMYLGPAHARCNVKAGNEKRWGKKPAPIVKTRRKSRIW